MSDLDLLKVGLVVTDLFERLDIPYAVGGSVASAIHGMARATLDIDIIAALEERHLAELHRALGGDFYLDLDAARDAIRRRASFNLIHQASMVKVDIFIPKARPFDQQQLTRAYRQSIEPESERGFVVTSAEDTVLAKLDWYRQGGELSERQWRDVLGIIRSRREALDPVYLTNTAFELGVQDLLERALVAADS